MRRKTGTKTGKKLRMRAAAFFISFSLGITQMAFMPEMKSCAAEPDPSESMAFEQEEAMAQQLEDIFTTVDLMDATISELQEEMVMGNLTSVRLTQMYIDRIKAYDEKLKLNSIISINPAALSDAARLDEERAEGKVRGPLHGIPIVVKANYDVAGMATSAGANALAGMIATEDAFVVKKLKESGAVILAQANMSEFAFSAADSASTLGGLVHNAYDGSKTSAGSSGGTAVAVTCNFAAAGLGTDTGGSIRNPACFSDLYGIRPSKGLTSISGVIPLMAERDTTGPMARTAEDMALILEAMAGSDEGDDFTLEADADALLGDGYMDALENASLKGKRIAFLSSSFTFERLDTSAITEPEEGEPEGGDPEGSDPEGGEPEGGDPEGSDPEGGDPEGGDPEVVEPPMVTVYPDEKINAMINRTLANLRKGGAEFVDLSQILPDDDIWQFAYGAADSTTEYDINRYLYERKDTAPYKTVKEILNSGKGINFSNLDISFADPSLLADSFEEMESPYTEDFGSYKRGPYWAYTLEGREYLMGILEEYDIDAVMYLPYYNAVPELPLLVWEATENYYPYTFGPAVGFPEISLPMGFSDAQGEYTSEMPLGLYLFSGFGQEETLMEIAYAYEQQAGENIRRMPAATPALPDGNLNAFLDDLMEKVYSIDYSMYNRKPEGKVQRMLNAYDKAKGVNLQDPYAVYAAAKALAEAYDQVMEALRDSGIDPDWAGFTYGAPQWKWDGTASAVAEFPCLENASLKKTVTAAITGKETKKATFSAPGLVCYTASAEFKGKTYTSTKYLISYVYREEWVDGVWYNKDGTQTYAYTLSWMRDSKGWWAEDTSGWYPRNCWQKIDGEWYYFGKSGYMAKNEWVDGCWLGRTGAWKYKKKAVWKRVGARWKYQTSDWTARSEWQKIDGKWYYFDADGYVVTGQRMINGKSYRFDASGVWVA